MQLYYLSMLSYPFGVLFASRILTSCQNTTSVSSRAIAGNDDILNVGQHPGVGTFGDIVSIHNLGCFTGTIVSFWTGDQLGPRK